MHKNVSTSENQSQIIKISDDVGMSSDLNPLMNEP